jgi:hypothetical protein
MSRCRHSCRHVCWLLSTSEQVAESLANVGGEEAVDERVCGRVEGSQALDEGRDGAVRRVVRNESENLTKEGIN